MAKSDQAISPFLTDLRVDLDHLDKDERTPLSWAVEEGALSVIKGLIRSRRVIIRRKDGKGRVTISYAAQHGHLDVVRLLLKSQLEQASVRDNVGWTPLAWAMNPPGYLENVTELLQSRTIDINRKDKVRGRTPLSLAATYGSPSIARLLSCTRGIHLDSRDATGRTPLSHAAGSGNIDVVSLLLSREDVDINSSDDDGCTPLSWVAREGCCEVIPLLLFNPNIDCLLRDGLDRLPHEVNLAYGQNRAANILQLSTIEGRQGEGFQD